MENEHRELTEAPPPAPAVTLVQELVGGSPLTSWEPTCPPKPAGAGRGSSAPRQECPHEPGTPGLARLGLEDSVGAPERWLEARSRAGQANRSWTLTRVSSAPGLSLLTTGAW